MQRPTAFHYMVSRIGYLPLVGFTWGGGHNRLIRRAMSLANIAQSQEVMPAGA